MFLESITLVTTSPCLAEPGKIIVTGRPACLLADAIPFIATLPGIIAYNPEALTITFRRQPGFLTLYPDKVIITQVKDPEEGEELFKALVDAINATWENRDRLIAVKQARRTPRPLDVWALLPRTNCKQCGEATCLAFAVGLLQQKQQLDHCLPLLADAALTDRRAALEAML
jgi:ArsR family metal-binding transcriptional regulator